MRILLVSLALSMGCGDEAAICDQLCIAEACDTQYNVCMDAIEGEDPDGEAEAVCDTEWEECVSFVDD